MPASGWLAVGSVLAALAAPSAGGLVVGLLAASLAVAGWSFRHRRARGIAIAGLGAGALAIRLLVLPAPPPAIAELPAGDGPWVANVQSIGPVRDGRQVATLRLIALGEVRLAATLPQASRRSSRGWRSRSRGLFARHRTTIHTATISAGPACRARSGRDRWRSCPPMPSPPTPSSA